MTLSFSLAPRTTAIASPTACPQEFSKTELVAGEPLTEEANEEERTSKSTDAVNGEENGDAAAPSAKKAKTVRTTTEASELVCFLFVCLCRRVLHHLLPSSVGLTPHSPTCPCSLHLSRRMWRQRPTRSRQPLLDPSQRRGRVVCYALSSPPIASASSARYHNKKKRKQTQKEIKRGREREGEYVCVCVLACWATHAFACLLVCSSLLLSPFYIFLLLLPSVPSLRPLLSSFPLSPFAPLLSLSRARARNRMRARALIRTACARMLKCRSGKPASSSAKKKRAKVRGLIFSAFRCESD